MSQFYLDTTRVPTAPSLTQHQVEDYIGADGVERFFTDLAELGEGDAIEQAVRLFRLRTSAQAAPAPHEFRALLNTLLHYPQPWPEGDGPISGLSAPHRVRVLSRSMPMVPLSAPERRKR